MLFSRVYCACRPPVCAVTKPLYFISLQVQVANGLSQYAWYRANFSRQQAYDHLKAVSKVCERFYASALKFVFLHFGNRHFCILYSFFFFLVLGCWFLLLLFFWGGDCFPSQLRFLLQVVCALACQSQSALRYLYRCRVLFQDGAFVIRNTDKGAGYSISIWASGDCTHLRYGLLLAIIVSPVWTIFSHPLRCLCNWAFVAVTHVLPASQPSCVLTWMPLLVPLVSMKAIWYVMYRDVLPFLRDWFWNSCLRATERPMDRT